MHKSTVVLLILAATLAPARAQELHYFGEELKPVLGVLHDAHRSGSIELAARCDTSPLGLPQFGSASATASSLLTALREVAASDPGMRVRQDANGTIRMAERGIPTDILNVRISHLVFENYAHHDIHSANFAVEVILSAPEVRSFMAAHDIAAPQITGPKGITGGPGESQWPPDAPRISGSLDKVTVLEALDRVLAAFPGEVFVYWNCPKAHENEHVKARTKQQEESKLFSNCPASSTQSGTAFPPRLPNPFCLPPSTLSALPQLFPIPEKPSHQRRIFIFFFAIKRFGSKTLIVGG